MADVPKAPDDAELRNIIDKLANFVARNGPEFEQMTMHKQRDNLKFSFLFGGEHYNYYKWKVAQEEFAKAPAADTKAVQQPVSVNTAAAAEAPPTDPEAPPPPWLHKQLGSTIVSVEQLLANKIEQEELLSQTGITDPSEGDFTNCIQPVLATCSKESIANGKSWIFQFIQQPNNDGNPCKKVATYLMRKTLDSVGVNFNQKLHVLYLINDIIHHWPSKNKSFRYSTTHILERPVKIESNLKRY